ncbi:MAG: SCP2 sterol-binding domain-containing protein [Ilumatobacteraceae bacterium]
MPHPFLSDEWIDAARAIREKYIGQVPKIPFSVRMNQVITKVPFGEGTLHSHIDTSTGELVMDLGHIEQPDLTVTTDYETARLLFLGRDPQAAMQAFLSGKVKVDGDMTKMMVLQSQQNQKDELAEQIAGEIQAITA